MSSDLLERIEDRSITMPRLVAVRLAGKPVTYAELADEIACRLEAGGYSDHSANAALFAALMNLLPYRLRTVGPHEDLRIVSSAIRWLNAYHGTGVEERRLQSVS
ncbi:MULTISPECIES: hypothetical protein [Gordonia]|nr:MULTISPECIES: hypothetical protein [Gordonia]WFN92094.1 hypothetical protein P5P27_15125 [Gordonia sihwensis]